MIFLDNSSSSFFKPRCVIEAVKNTIEYLPFNPSRSSHSGALKAGRLLLSARERLAQSFGCDSEGVIFTGGCTEALNLAIFGAGREGGHVITTVFEHNAVLRPLHRLNKAGIINLSLVSSVSGAAAAVTDKTYMLVINHVSNVTGAAADLFAYGEIAKKHGLIFVVDAAQSAGYKQICMKSTGVDCLALAPHKGLHAIAGAGALLLSDKVIGGALGRFTPFKYGGTGTASSSPVQPDDMPDGFEAGTLPTPAIASVNTGTAWSIANLKTNADKLNKMSAYMIEGLEKICGVTVYSHPNDCGIVAFTIGSMTSQEAGDIYDQQYDIALRCGFHCAPLLHQHYETKSGMIRASIGVETTISELDAFLEATKEISN